jgi:hypothetical protein
VCWGHDVCPGAMRCELPACLSMPMHCASQRMLTYHLLAAVCFLQTFKPHKEKHETTVPKSPLLRTKLRSHTVRPAAAVHHWHVDHV